MDKRVRHKISFLSDKNTTISKLNFPLSKKSGIRLQRGNPKRYEGVYTSDDLFQFRLYCSNLETGAVIDALASLDGMRVTRLLKTSSTGFDYDFSMAHEQFFKNHLAVDENQAKYWDTIAPFFDYVDKSKDKDKWITGEKFKMSEMPSTFQPVFQKFLQEVYDSSPDSKGDPRDMSNVTKALIHIDNQTPVGAGYSEYFLHMSTIYGNFGARISNFPSKLKKSNNSIIILPDEDRSEILSGIYSISYFDEKVKKRELAIKSDSMNIIYSYQSKDTNLFSVLKALSSTEKLNFVSSPDWLDMKRKSVKYDQLPLWKLLDQLCFDFGGWSWELRESGVILLRHPKNPRHRELPAESE